MIRLYATKCVMCLQVEHMLAQRGIKFVKMEIDNGVRAFFKQEGITEVPVLEIKDGIEFREGRDCITWINEEYEP